MLGAIIDPIVLEASVERISQAVHPAHQIQAHTKVDIAEWTQPGPSESESAPGRRPGDGASAAVPVTVTLAVTFKLPHHLPGPNGSICRAYLAHHLPGAGPVTTNQDISRSRYRLLDY